MERLSDAHHFRKMVAGVCMMAAPLLLLVGVVLHPEAKDDAAEQIAVIAANQDQWLAAHLIILAAIVLFVPAVLGLMHMLREREVAFGHVGGGLALLGLLAVTGVIAIELVAWQMAQSGDLAAMASVYDDVMNGAATMVPFYLLPICSVLGLMALALGLYRAHAVASWMAVSIAAGALLWGIGFAAASLPIAIVAAAFLLVGLGSLGRIVYMESDADWEHTPEHPGFRPLPGLR